MRILTVCEFDPCGVALRHRKYLRTLGVDYRLAARDVYWDEGAGADWWVQRGVVRRDAPQQPWTWEANPEGCDFETLREFADAADIIQFCPSIGQPWSFQDTTPRPIGADVGQPFGPIDWSVTGRRAKRVALIHGSLNAAANAATYATEYRQAGYAVLATTLDYVHWMGAGYVPPVVDLMAWEPADRYQDGEVRVIHTPSDPRLCASQEFLDVSRGIARITVVLGRGLTHEQCLAAKQRCHAGYDHVRGSFSINSLENAALGLVNLVAVEPRYRDWLRNRWSVELPWPRIENMGDVRCWMERLSTGGSDLVGGLQDKARQWYEREWSPILTAERVLGEYERCLS